MADRPQLPRFALCVKNDGYPSSLAVGRLYQELPDPESGAKGLVRVIDELGEEYLFPAALFVVVDLPKPTADALLSAL